MEVADEIEGQFDDAEEDGVTADKRSGVPSDEDSFSSDGEVGDNWGCDWDDETSDFTKRYNATRSGQPQANKNVPSSAKPRDPSGNSSAACTQASPRRSK